MKPLMIFGTTSFAEIAYLYFSRGTDYEVVAFCCDKEFLEDDTKFGLPVLEKNQILTQPSKFPPNIFIAVTYSDMNRNREKILNEFIAKNFQPASYVSPYAFVDETVQLGKHVFIFENNVIQPFTKIGSNVVLWSGNHIGHHSTIADNVFISSHVVLSGHSSIGRNSFIGVNSSIGNNISIGDFNWLLPGTNLVADTANWEAWRPQRPQLASKHPGT